MVSAPGEAIGQANNDTQRLTKKLDDAVVGMVYQPIGSFSEGEFPCRSYTETVAGH